MRGDTKHARILRLLVHLTLIVAPLIACAPTLVPRLSWEPAEDLSDHLKGHSLEAPYQEALNQWTRRGELFERLEGELFVSATCLSPSFEMLRASRHGARQSLTITELNAERLNLLQRSRSQRLFFVAIATNSQGFNDLRPRGSALKAHLLVGDEVLEPLWITELNTQERLSAPVDFPYLTPLYKSYWVSFPAQPDARELSLRISSLRGTLTLNWALSEQDAHAMRGP